MCLDTEILLTAFCLLRLRVLLFGEIKHYNSPIRIEKKKKRRLGIYLIKGEVCWLATLCDTCAISVNRIYSFQWFILLVSDFISCFVAVSPGYV